MTSRLPRLFVLGGLVLGLWMALLSATAFGSRSSDAVLAWVPPDRMAEVLAAAPVSLVDAGSRGFVVLRGDAPGFVSALYASGAWLVLPARRRGGCAAGLLTP